MQFSGIPSELANSVIPLIIFFVAINYIVRVGLAKVMGGKKEVETVQEIESAPNEESEKGGKV